MIVFNAQEISVLQHTASNGRYVTDEAFVIDMAVRGLLKDYGAQKPADGMHYFTLAEPGRQMLAAHAATLPKPRPLTRSQLRYREYRSVADCYRDFGHWLRCHFLKKEKTI